MGELRIGNPVVAGGVTLVPVERSSVQFEKGDRGYWLSGLKEPVAIVVCDADGGRAFDAVAEEVSVESLVRQIPDLGRILKGLTT